MPQSMIHEMLYMKHPTRLKILQGVFLCSNLVVQMDPDPVHQAQVVTQDLHPVRSDGAEPYRAVYRETVYDQTSSCSRTATSSLFRATQVMQRHLS